MAFFQRPTEYPCQLILDPQNDYETLRRRVEQTTLKAQTVNCNRSGVTNVSERPQEVQVINRQVRSGEAGLAPTAGG